VFIDSPTNGLVAVPAIQIRGRIVGNISNIACDVFASGNSRTNRRNYSIRWGFGPEETATNHFVCSGLLLSKGTNLIVLRTDFDDGRKLTNQVTCVLDYSKFTNPPDLKIIWPTNYSSIGGATFNLQAQVADASTAIHVSISRSNRSPLEFDDAIVSGNGGVILKDLPLEDGTNFINVVAKDAAGNSNAVKMILFKSPVEITIRPINFDQINRRLLTVIGIISDPTLAVWVNDHQATVAANGQWKAEGVGFQGGGMAFSPRPEFRRLDRRPRPAFYLTVSAFSGKKMVATQQFEVNP
jgi:hypothetical protein